MNEQRRELYTSEMNNGEVWLVGIIYYIQTESYLAIVRK